MQDKTIGRFYFKQTSNGNLIGEFSNDNSQDEISTESAERKVHNDGFAGDYVSTWQENGGPCYAKLSISPKKNVWTKIFSLTWVETNGTRIFEGEGMFCGDILIGDYRNVPRTRGKSALE